MAQPQNLAGILDHLDDQAKGDALKFGEILKVFGSRSYGPLLVAVALVELLPTGAIPGIPTVLAVIIILLAGQLAAGKTSPWIPAKLRNLSLERNKLEKGRSKIRALTQKLDKFIKPRMAQFTSPLANRWVGVICVLLALTMPPLELIPFASSMPSAAVGLFGIGLTGDDGLIIMLAGIVAVCAAAGAVYWLA